MSPSSPLLPFTLHEAAARRRVGFAWKFVMAGLAAGIMMSTPVGVHGQAAAAKGAAPTLVDIDAIGDLKTMFNKDAGKHRLVLLLSPT